MNLVIDLSKKEPRLILERGKKRIAGWQWTGLYQLSETLLKEIDRFLKKNGTKLEEIGRIKVIPSSESIVSTRIAKATALGLKFKQIL